MDNGLERIRIIDRGRLRGGSYFQTLLDEARSKGLLGDNDIERLQYECISLLADRTERYNDGNSSSIRVEKAQSIMASILFTVGLWLKTYPGPDDAAAALRIEPISVLYQKGRRRIDTMLMSAKSVHKKLVKQLIQTENVFYRSMIEDGIDGFFQLYCPDFEAQEIPITVDYRAYNPIPGLAGIEFITAYLNALSRENRFCAYFSSDGIHSLLCGYAEDYGEMLINIYELVLTAAIGCITAGTDVYGLDITDGGAERPEHLFAELPRSEIFKTVLNSAEEIIRRLRCPAGLAEYIQNSVPRIARNIEIAARGHTLNRVFFPPVFAAEA